MSAGKIVMPSSGKFALDSSGKRRLYNGSGECAECCGSGECDIGDIDVTLSLRGIDGNHLTDCVEDLFHGVINSREFTSSSGHNGDYDLTLEFNEFSTWPDCLYRKTDFFDLTTGLDSDTYTSTNCSGFPFAVNLSEIQVTVTLVDSLSPGPISGISASYQSTGAVICDWSSAVEGDGGQFGVWLPNLQIQSADPFRYYPFGSNGEMKVSLA